MSTVWKPAGYPSLSPYMMVAGAPRLIGFLQQAFGGTELRRYDGPDGTVLHAEVRLDNGVVMLAEGGPEYPAFPAWLHLYVVDVDATYRRALAAGASAVQEPQQKPGDPDRRGGVKDPVGNTWWISMQAGGEASP